MNINENGLKEKKKKSQKMNALKTHKTIVSD